MAMILKQSTAVDVLIGPFLDISDGAAAESGESPSVKLSKNGQALAAKNDVTTPVHDADGYYNCELDATDTNTVGTLVLSVAASATALPVRHEFQVVEEATYDFLYASGATPIADINAEVDTALTDYDAVVPADLPTNFADLAITATTGRVTVGTNNDKTGYSISGTKTTLDALNDVSTAQVNAEADTALTDYDPPTRAELTSDKNEIITDIDDVKGTGFVKDTHSLTDIQSDTNELQGDDVPGLIAALNNLSAAQVNAEVDTALADYDGPTNAEMTAAFTEIKGATWGVTDTLEAIRDRGDAAWTTAVGFSTHSAADVWAAATRTLTANTNLNDPTAADVASAVLTTAMTESYAANGAAPTLAQAQFAIHQMLMQFGISGTSITVKKLDNATTAFVVTLDDGTNPTSAERQ